MSKVFDKEVDAWSGLHESKDGARRRRYALFQKNAKLRVRKRRELALELLQIRPDTRVLDLTCGSGILGPAFVAAGARWVGMDISRNMLARGRAESREADERKSWVNASADAITWLRSRLYPMLPLPFSAPGPLYRVPYPLVQRAAEEAGFRCERLVQVPKYLGLPHYAMFKLVKPSSAGRDLE